MRPLWKRWLTFLTALSLVVLTGCEDVNNWCETYNRGYAYVNTFAIPALDVASGLTPDWQTQYEASKALLGTINEQLVSFCVRHENGEAVSANDLAPLVADGSKILAEIISLYQTFAAADANGTRDIGVRGVDANALYADLMQCAEDAENH